LLLINSPIVVNILS